MLFEVNRESGIPLVGALYFGVIDRGTNLLQIRPFCGCNLACPFCSVDAGPYSKTRVTNYNVELEYLLDWTRKIAEFKGEDDIECFIDSVGEPMLYPKFMELVKGLRKIPQIKHISLQTNGTLLTKEIIRKLEESGLDKINLSIISLDKEQAKELAGMPWYDIEKIKEAAKEIAKSRIDLLIAPVYLPGINDSEIPKIIKFGLEIGAGKKWPAFGIQKFEKYKLGRKPKGIKVQSWWQFYNRSIKAWEKEFGVKLTVGQKEFGVHKAKSLPIVMEKGEKLKVRIAGPGWLTGEKLAVARDRCISVLDCAKESGEIRVKILSNKHNIYVAKPV